MIVKIVFPQCGDGSTRGPGVDWLAVNTPQGWDTKDMFGKLRNSYSSFGIYDSPPFCPSWVLGSACAQKFVWPHT